MCATAAPKKEIDLAKTEKILDKYKGLKGALIPVLQKIQDEYGYVPEEAAYLAAERLGVYPSQIFGVLTFYTQFHLEPRGKYIMKICCGTACHVKGAPGILDRMEATLNVKAGQTTEDGLFTVEKVNCVGACSLAPIIVVNKDAHGKVVSDDVTNIVKELRARPN